MIGEPCRNVSGVTPTPQWDMQQTSYNRQEWRWQHPCGKAVHVHFKFISCILTCPVQYVCCVLSHVQFFATPWMQPARLLCRWDFPSQARILQWVVISPSRGFFQSSDRNYVSCFSACIGSWTLLPLSHLGSPVQRPRSCICVTAASVQLCAALPASHPSRNKLVNGCLISLLINFKSGTNWYWINGCISCTYKQKFSLPFLLAQV